MIIIITMNSNKVIINKQEHFKKYVEEINKLSNKFSKKINF